MQRGAIGPGELRPAEIIKLPDGRERVTRWRAVSGGRSAASLMFVAYGAVDPAAKTGVAGGTTPTVRLVDQRVGDFNGEPALIQVYEEIPATAEIQVGGNTRIELEDGRVGIEANFLQYTAGSYVPGTVGTTTAPGDTSAFLQRAEQTNDGGLRRIKRTYVYAGQIAQSDSTGEQGMLLTRSITSVKTVPGTPSGYTFIRSEVNPVNGLPVYHYTFVKGAGLVMVAIEARNDGLRTETHVAYGTKSTPSGVVTRDDYREADGYRVFTVTAMQAEDGSAVTGAEVEVERWVPFTYPGRAKAFAETYDSGKVNLAVFLSPPVATQVLATVTTSYQTANTLGSIGTFWNPSEWATIKAQWVGGYGRAASQLEALPGYRSVSDAPVTHTGTGFDSTIYGGIIYNGSTAEITVSGGPDDPGGETLVLHAELEPAFTSVTGTKYFRKTIIVATIPAQASLPV